VIENSNEVAIAIKICNIATKSSSALIFAMIGSIGIHVLY